MAKTRDIEGDAETTATPFTFQVTERAPLSVLVARQLREAIVSGQIAVGTELPSEKELTIQLGVSRSTVREALRILQAQGLISGGDTVSTQRPRVTGEYVMSSAALAMESVLRLGGVPLADLVELRVVIEGAALEQAALVREETALLAAREAVEAMGAPDINVDAFRAADLSFHKSLVGASGNQAYGLVMGVLRDAVSAHLGEALHQVPKPERTMRELTTEHAEILRAVERGQSKRAKSLVEEHIRAFYAARKRTQEAR